jgi:mono/diheme cytochrome c family protein
MKMNLRRAVLLFAVLAVVPVGYLSSDLRAAPAQEPAQPLEFNRDIQPILARSCLACHGPNENTRQADLRLDTHDFIGTLVVPGDAEASPLFRRLTTGDSVQRMPPASSGRSLTDEQIEAVRLWIDGGAHWDSEVAVAADAAAVPARVVDFAREVRPILSEKCFTCHGPDAQARQRGLRLDVAEGPFAERGDFGGPVIVPGNAEESLLIHRVSASDALVRMPYRLGLNTPVMPGADEDALSPDQIETLRLWIDQGAEWQSHWAFIPPERQSVPPVAGAEWVRNPIDNFVKARLEQDGREPSPEADLLTLLRRATFDLTGLPPADGDIAAVLSDDSPDAYENAVDKMLGSSAFGERMAVDWLDAARYADSSGYQTDAERSMWRYRDWVIDAYNANMPFDQFTIEQIAGDLMPDATLEQRIATAFNRNHSQNGEGGIIPEEFLVENVVDRVSTTGTVWMGLTLGCARCHDHKFDPILQKDYYSMQASIFGYVEIDYPLLDRAGVAEYREKNAAIDAHQQPLRDEIAEIEAPHSERLRLELIRERFPENVQQAALKPEEERTPGEQLLAAQVLSINPPRRQVVEALSEAEGDRWSKLTAAVEALEALRPPEPPMAEIVTDGDYRFAPDGPGDQVIGCPECRILPDEPGSFLYEEGGPAYEAPPNYFLIRGDPFSPGSPMSPGFLTVATYGDPPAERPRPDGRTSGRRLALAEWIASRDNPLTARVMVNRIWQHHFGQGLVRTASDFGRNGSGTLHQDLLDWLAWQFVERGWSVKEMHRLLMTSEAYQMASAHEDAGNRAADPENRLLWQYRPQRLEAEALRDAIMTVSGGIDLTVGGPPVFPHVPQELLEASRNGYWENQADGPEVWRRSVYVYRRRSLGFPFFDTFDLPDQNQTAAARNVSTVATQALTLMNNEFVLNQARLFAERLERAAPGDVDRQIDLAYRIALTRPPAPDEAEIARGLVSSQSLVDLTHVMLNLNEFLYLR